ncbi:hypothetical protein HDU85_004032 [Gaertneriomyces sp. JEL0708]|nr:hypothetical protein HDU85_004032 [Gaertneriomyces sp. JEL0708]
MESISRPKKKLTLPTINGPGVSRENSASPSAAANLMVDDMEPGVMGSAGDASLTRLNYDFDKYRMPDDETEKSDGEDDGIEKSLKAYVLKK